MAQSGGTARMKYVVNKGESLWNLAERFLGDGKRYKEIKKASGITSDTLQIGQVLTIPEDKTALEKALVQCVEDVEKLPSFQRLYNTYLKDSFN